MFGSSVNVRALMIWLACSVWGVAAIFADAADEAKPKAASGQTKSTFVAFGEAAVYKRVDNRELKVYIVKPADWKPIDQRPAVVFFHGGGWQGGTPKQFEEHSKYLASRGMVCVNAEYRLLDRKSKEPPTVCIQDAKSAMRWTRSHADTLGIDPGRIAAGGGSAGGHLAGFVGIMDGIDDPQDDLTISARANALLLFNPVIDNSNAGYGADRIGDRLKEFSPAHNVNAKAAPTIIFVGSLDTAIRPAAVQKFREEMTKAGVRCEARIYQDQRHGFFNFSATNPQFYLITLRETDLFLASLGWLEGEPKIPVPDVKPDTPMKDPATKTTPEKPAAKKSSLLNAKESDPRLQSDGKGWRLQKAKITDATLPRVLMIGDSILNGYLDEVTKILDGKAYLDAWVTPTHQGDKQLPRIIEEVMAQGPYQVVHFNLGLHGWQAGRIPEGQFEPLTRQMVQAFRKHAPDAKLVWASTTPVTKQGMPGELEPEINPAIIEHNRMAANVMTDEKVMINDLYSLMVPKLTLARGDKFHWGNEGRSLQAHAVAAAIQNALRDFGKKDADQ